MRIKVKNIVLLWVMAVALGLAGAELKAQSFTTLYDFTAVQSANNTDGGFPKSGLALAGGTLYGVASGGGQSGNGTIFSINGNSSNFISLHQFTGTDGANPYGGMILSGNTLYGIAPNGGSSGNGAIFSIQTNGAAFTVLYDFSATSGGNETNSDGANPAGSLVLSGNTLYGATTFGGSGGYGTLFSFDIGATNVVTLRHFTGGLDGRYPQAGLMLAAGTLYGTASQGGNAGNGTVFSINTAGGGFMVLHSFTPVAYDPAIVSFTNTDGAYPYAGLILAGNVLYGTAEEGGAGGVGTVFALNTGGSGFTTLHGFSAISNSNGHGNNRDGAFPLASLILSGNILYGTANGGGSSGYGAVFGVNTNGSGFANMHSFTAPAGSFGINSDGAEPNGNLVLSGNNLFATAALGGSGGDGTLFSIFVVPQLNIEAVGADVVLSWPVSATGFGLQSTASLNPPAAWITVSSTPSVINGFNTVTLTNTGGQMYFRLSSVSTLPQLSISAAGGSVVLTWAASATGFGLQSAPGLNPPIAWTTLSTMPTANNGFNTVTLTNTGGQMFYRLIK